MVNLAGQRVLVVDDSHINRLILREMIAGCGAAVSEADSGTAALAEIRRAAEAGKPYSLVLLDLRMPEMDGLEVARRIREEQLAMSPVILMLASQDVKPRLRHLRELVLDSYVVKPIRRKELFAAIRRLLGQSNRGNSEKPATSNAVVAPLPVPAPSGRSARILVAEDSPDNRLLIGAYLRREPYQVDFAEDGEQAVALFVAHDDYDMIFMDIQMPRMDGLHATRRIRELEGEYGRRPLPIIALTASVLEEDVARTRAAGCNLHLSKPVKKRLLLDTIRNAVPTPVIEEPPEPPAAVTELPNGASFGK